MMNRYLQTLFLIAALAGFLPAGCAGPTRLEKDYGTSYRLQLANQTLNPEAYLNLKPVTGLEAPAAENLMRKYYKSFGEKQKKQALNPYVFSIGASSGSY